MKGLITTDKISISIKKEIHTNLIEYCEDNSVNKSKIISKLIEEFLKTKNGKNK